MVLCGHRKCRGSRPRGVIQEKSFCSLRTLNFGRELTERWLSLLSVLAPISVLSVTSRLSTGFGREDIEHPELIKQEQLLADVGGTGAPTNLVQNLAQRFHPIAPAQNFNLPSRHRPLELCIERSAFQQDDRQLDASLCAPPG